MRAAGIPVGMEVMDAELRRGAAGASPEAVEELVREIDAHFSAHLAPVFPRLV